MSPSQPPDPSAAARAFKTRDLLLALSNWGTGIKTRLATAKEAEWVDTVPTSANVYKPFPNEKRYLRVSNEGIISYVDFGHQGLKQVKPPPRAESASEEGVMAPKELEPRLQAAMKGRSVIDIIKMLIALLNIHWADTTEGTQRFDPIPNPKRYLVFSPRWMPPALHRYYDCGEPGTKVP